MGTICGICISEKKGTQKHVVTEDWGVRLDAHAGKWHRQVSLLGLEQIDAFRARGADVAFGDFGENLIVSGYRVNTLPVGTRLRAGKTAVLEITQIGKQCHDRCAIYREMGDCIMPREGVFARVLRGGTICPGDEITVLAGDGGEASAQP